jgi:hypothetical protein
MSVMDEIIKWLKTPKTIRGIAGMVVIIIVLALDFAWWAGNIDVTASIIGANNDDGGEEVGEWEYILDVDDSHSDSLLLPSGGVIIIGGTSVKDYPFEVKETAFSGFINVTASGTHARPDLDLKVYGPDGSEVGSSATEQADEYVELDYKVFNRTGPGTYIAEVENYSTFNVDFTLTIQVWNNVTVEGTEEKP